MAVLYTPFENLQAIYFVDWKWSCKCIKKKKSGFFSDLETYYQIPLWNLKKNWKEGSIFFFIIHRTVLIQAIRVLKFIRITWVTTALHPSLVVVSVETVLIAHQCLVAAEWWVCVRGAEPGCLIGKSCHHAAAGWGLTGMHAACGLDMPELSHTGSRC